MDFSNKCNISRKTPSSSPVPDWEQIPTEVTYNWVGITDEFKNATDQLKLGELVHEPNFGLFEAMSAIEMMDPKMDAGMVGKQSTNSELEVENKEKHPLKLDNLDFDELITIMDTCQVSILSWLGGHSLAQSVFTCLYLHKPDDIKDRCLRAYSIGTLKLCDIIKDKIYKANVLEEEDFQTLTYGFKFANNVTEMRSIGMLKEMEDEYNRMLRNVKSKQSADDSENAREVSFLQALLARVKFLRLFLQVLLPFGVKDEVGEKKAILAMQEQLKIINKTVNLGKESQIIDGKEVVIGVDPLVNQRLLPPTFPRYTKLRNRNEFCECYEKIVARLLLITEMTSLSTFKSILEFIVDFAKTGPCILTRSLVQLAFMPENFRAVGRVLGHSFITDSLKESMRLFNAPLSLSMKYSILYNSPKAKEILDVFVIRASRTMKKLVQVYGHNYARQREKLANLLEDLSDLEDEAERCDSDLHSLMQNLDPKGGRSHLTSVGSWTLYHTLRVMIQYVLSGFQLELYSDHEFHYIYWYLAEVLLTWMITTLNRAEGDLQKEELMVADQALKSKKKAKKNKKKGKTHTKELAVIQGMQMMSAGCFKALLGFFISGKLKSPECKYGSEMFRYEHRFSPFMGVVTPPFMPYKQFQEITDVSQYYPPPTAQNLYASSSKHFLQAKQLYEAMLPGDEVSKLLKVAKTNLIVTKLLADGHKQNSTDTPHFDFSVHHVFPIFKV